MDKDPNKTGKLYVQYRRELEAALNQSAWPTVVRDHWKRMFLGRTQPEFKDYKEALRLLRVKRGVGVTVPSDLVHRFGNDRSWIRPYIYIFGPYLDMALRVFVVKYPDTL